MEQDTTERRCWRPTPLAWALHFCPTAGIRATSMLAFFQQQSRSVRYRAPNEFLRERSLLRVVSYTTAENVYSVRSEVSLCSMQRTLTCHAQRAAQCPHEAYRSITGSAQVHVRMSRETKECHSSSRWKTQTAKGAKHSRMAKPPSALPRTCAAGSMLPIGSMRMHC